MASRSEQLRSRLQQGDSARQRVLSRVYGQEPQAPAAPEVTISPRTAALRSFAIQSNDAERDRAAQGQQRLKQYGLDAAGLMDSIERITAPQGAPVQRPEMFMPKPQAPRVLSDAEKYVEENRQKRADQGVPDWLNNLLGNVDEFLYASPAGRQITGFGQGVAEALTGVEAASGTPQVGSRAARLAGSLASGAVNPAAPETSLIQGGYRVAEGVLGTRAGQAVARGAAKGLEKAGVRSGTANNVAQNLVRGGIAGATQNVAQMAAAGQTSGQQLAENALIGGALGAVGDAGVGLISSGVRNLLQKYRNNAANPEAIDRILALPAPRERGNANAAETPDVINIPETGPRGLPEPSPETAAQARNMNDARAEIAAIDDELRSLESRYQQAINEQYQYLKESMRGRGGVEQGGLIRNDAGEVVGRVGRTSNNPEWFREFFQANGRTPNNRDLYDLAKRHVDEGFIDAGVAVPSWRVQNDYDETIDALQQVRQQLSGYAQDQTANVEAPRTVPARAPGVKPVPRDAGATTADVPSSAAADVPEEINVLLKEYQEADAALAELDRRYAAGGSPGPEEVQRMIELEGRKAAAASRIQQAVSAGDRPFSVPEGIQARVAATTEAAPRPSTGAAAAAPEPSLPTTGIVAEDGVLARAKPPGGPRSAGPTKPTTTKTISRAKLIENIRRNLGVTISTGRTGYDRNQVLGIYKQQPEVIRTGYAEDYDTIAHEIGHDFTKRYKLDDPQFLQELTHMMDTMNVHNYRQYPPNQWLDEGIAEYMRAYLSNPAQARQLAPRFTEFFEGRMPAKIRRGLANVQRDIAIWEGQGDYNRAVGKVDFDGGSKKERASWDKWYTRYVDDLNPMKLIEKALTGTVNIGSKSIYKLARLSRGVGERAKMAITRGIFDDRGKELSVGLRQIVEPLEMIGMTEKDFGTYLAAVHAQDLKRMGKTIPFDDNELLAVTMRWGNNPTVQKAQQQIVQYNNALLDLMVDAQLLSRAAVTEMRRKYPNYVPFMRYFDDDAVAGFKNGGYGAAKGFANITNPVKRMSEEGSERTIINPIESMVKNTFLVMNAAAKNKVGLQLADLAKIDGAGAWVEHVPGASDPKEHIVNVKINGENQAYKIRDPELYNAMLSLDNESVNSLIRFLGGTASLLRAGATLTPEFTIRNAFRDVAGAIINSTKYGFNPLDFFRGFFHTVTKSDVYEKFVNSGGAVSTMMALDRDTNREALEAIYKLSLKDRALNVVTSPKELAKFLSGYTPAKTAVSLLRKGAEISELSTKVGAFNKTLKKTGDLEEAAYTARDLMDFNRAGSAVRQANKAIAFLNASIQGTDKMARAFWGSGAKDIRSKASFLTRAFTTLVLPATLGYFWNRYLLSDEERATFENIPQWQKDSFFVIGIPGTGEFVRIPKPFEAGMLFATSTERMLDWLHGNDKDAFDKYGKATLESMTPPVLFTALSPLLEAITNHSFYRDAPVVPQGEQRLEKKDQYGVYTSELAKEIGSFLDSIGLGNTNAASPRIIDNTIKGYTAGLGQYGVDLIDKAIETVRGEKAAAEPAKKWTEDPFFRSFFVSTAGGGQVRQDFYDRWDKLTAAKASAARNEETFKQQREYDRMNRYNKQISKLNKEYKKIQQSKTLTAEQKRSQLDALDDKMNAAAAAALGKQATP